MSCGHWRAESMEAAREGGVGSVEAAAHRAVCGGCAEEFERQVEISAVIASLAAAPTAEAPLAIEGRVLAAFDARARGGLGKVDWRALRAGQAGSLSYWAAAAIVLIVASLAIHRPGISPDSAAAPFVEIPYVAPLAPYERTEVRRMDVPVAALIAAGFDVHASDTGGSLRADVLFGQDGRAHAIRLLGNEGRIDQ